MCLGVPGKITEIYMADTLRMGKIDFGGVIREACLEYIPDAEIGEYVVIHVGFAISRLSEEEAQETLKMLREISAFDEHDGTFKPIGTSAGLSNQLSAQLLSFITTHNLVRGQWIHEGSDKNTVGFHIQPQIVATIAYQMLSKDYKSKEVCIFSNG